MDNAIAYIFEKHNIVELKNPNEPLNIDIVWKGISYAAQYKSRGYDDTSKNHGINIVSMKDITLTFLRISKPVALFDELNKSGYGLEQRFPGVYYVFGIADIKMQIVVGNELEGDDFAPIRVQNKNATEEDAAKFIKLAESTIGTFDKELTDSIFQISIKENQSLYERLRRERSDMCEAMRLLFKEELAEQYKLGSTDGYKSGSADGYKFGVTDGKTSIARNMIKRGYNTDEIVALTSLPFDVIEKERKKVIQ